jgi:TonB dependent receptor
MERVRSFEAALKYQKNYFSGEAIFFSQQGHNLVVGNQFAQYYSSFNFDSVWRYGYENFPGLTHKIWGIQGIFRNESRSVFTVNSRKKKTEVSSRTEFFIQYVRGKEWYSPGKFVDEPINQPKWHTQFRTFFYIGKNTEIMFASNRQTAVLNRAITYADFYQLVPGLNFRSPTFRTWDMMVRIYLSKQFLVYLNFQNLFNKRYGGLDATGTIDDLLINTQPGRSFRFGLNYNMN